MFKSVLLSAVITASLFVVSCSSDEGMHEKEVQKVVLNYLDDFVRNELEYEEFTLDTLVVNDVSQKTQLMDEALSKNGEVQKIIDEAKVLRDEYLDIGELRSVLGGGDRALDRAYKRDEAKLKAEFVKKRDLAGEILKEVEILRNKSKEADSVAVIYYKVIVSGDVIKANDVQRSALFRFHLSPEYKIIKEPLDFLN